MELRILFKNTIYLLTTRVVKFAINFIRTKLIAIFLGTLGAGIIVQLNQLTESMTQFSLLSMNDGLVKEIAESNKSEKEFNQKLSSLIKSYIVMVLFISMLVLVVSIYFSKELNKYFLGSDKYYGYFLIGLVSFPILVINSISFAILKSFKEIKYIARSEIVVVVINLLIFIPMIYFGGLTGVVIHLTISLTIILLINQYYAKTIVLNNYKISIKDILKAKVNRKAINGFFVFAGYGLTAGIALLFTDLSTRAIVVTKLGISQIGIYSPVIVWAGLFTSFIIPSIGTYLYPRFCECKSDSEVVGILNDSLRFVTLLMLPILLISIPIRFQIIPLFYSKEFINAGNFLPWHFLGLLFFLWRYAFIQAMIPTGRLKIVGIVTIITCLIDFFVVYILVPIIGLYGLMLKFLVSPIIIFVFYIFYWKSQIQFRFEPKNIIILGYTLISFTLMIIFEKYVTSNYKIDLLIGLLLTGSSLLILDKSERKYIVNNRYLTEILKYLRSS